MRRWTAERGLDEVVVGRDGFATLVLSCAVIMASCGLTLLTTLRHVLRVGRRAGIEPAKVGMKLDVSVVVVLGMQLDRHGRITSRFRSRLDRAAALLASRPEATAVVLGGRTRAAAPSEAEAGRDYLVAAGVSSPRIAVEDRSRHTLENLRLYREAFGASPDNLPALVTNRYHLARCAMMANGLGIAHRLVAAEAEEAPRLAEAGACFQEALLVHWYLTGRIFSVWTGNRRMLRRIS